MKKKKLKKRIEHLERNIEAHGNALLKMVPDIQRTKERVNKLEEDNKYYKEWMDRSGVDYKSWFEGNLKSCSNCKYNGWSIDVAPCEGCTDTDKKMWKSKEA